MLQPKNQLTGHLLLSEKLQQAAVLPASFSELGVVFLNLRLAFLDCRVEQEYE